MNKLIPKILFSICLLLPSNPTWGEEGRKVIPVGVVLHLSGDLAMQSAAFREGIELATEEINVSTNNFKIELLVEDGHNNPKASNTAVQKLLSYNKVSAVILSSYLDAMANGALLERQKTPSIILWDSSPEIEDIGDFTFAIGPWTPSAGEEAARFAVEKLRAKTAAIVTNSDPWSEAVGKYFKGEFERVGGTIVEEAIFSASDTDFRTVLSRIMSK